MLVRVCVTYARVVPARSAPTFFNVTFNLRGYESKSSGNHTHPQNIFLHNHISFTEDNRKSGVKAIYTDGSKTDEAIEIVYCLLKNHGIIVSWQGKMNHNNNQAEILAIKMTIKADSSFHGSIKIWTDSLPSLMDILNPKFHHSMEIQTLLLSKKHIT
ncbi:hypothetical protein AVEN_89745-1 [Araneus ventricosus]|uniref:RNase H type-1 domain-containing protein n=1 Tax=Araneus ventricosus TaxID=182803 RepID=A0A4Y2J9D6_ARAVE|nr:hypothetical protein AVEN_89745-1 [Araneus ventricosus]